MYSQEQIKEATKRLAMLDLHPNVLKEWRESNTLYYSERARWGNTPVGILYWISNKEKLVEAVRDFQNKYDAVVYHCTHEYFEFGEVLDMFYVSKNKEDWEQDREDLKSGYAFVNACNLDDASMSDFGTIGFKAVGGGLVRTA